MANDHSRSSLASIDSIPSVLDQCFVLTKDLAASSMICKSNSMRPAITSMASVGVVLYAPEINLNAPEMVITFKPQYKIIYGIGIVNPSSTKAYDICMIKLDFLSQRFKIKGTWRFRDRKLWRNTLCKSAK